LITHPMHLDMQHKQRVAGRRVAGRAALLALALLSIASAAAAQIGTLDQTSPYSSGSNGAGFSVDSPGLIWQLQVRAAVAGQLEGFNLKLDGQAGSQTDVNLRIGDGWNSTAIVFTTQVTKAQAGPEIVFVSVLSAAITLSHGDTFVIELQGNATGCSAIGSYIPPTAGLPLYPEPLFLSGPGCFADCGWRIGFETYVLAGGPGSVTPYCFGVGCPCGNDDAAAGCANSTGAGALLAHTGGGPSVIADNLSMSVTAMPLNVAGLLFAGNARVNVPFHDGRRCAQGVIKRFGLQNAGGAGSISLSHPPRT